MSTISVNFPCIITSRLLPGVRVSESEISIAYDGVSSDGRTIYRYWLDLKIDDRRIEYCDNDLQSGVGGGSLQDGLESLLSFLTACGESYGYAMRKNGQLVDDDGNANLFPADVAEWSYINSDELGMLAYDLAETDNVIVE